MTRSLPLVLLNPNQRNYVGSNGASLGHFGRAGACSTLGFVGSQCFFDVSRRDGQLTDGAAVAAIRRYLYIMLGPVAGVLGR